MRIVGYVNLPYIFLNYFFTLLLLLAQQLCE
jgi:hypothetical protein